MINRILYKLIESSYKLDNEDFVSIFADPRSGSTWLAESLKSIPNSIVIDEPLHLTYLKKYGIENLCWRQYIPENEKFDLLEKYFQDIIHGRHMSAGLIRINKISELLKAEATILKVIRGKLLLPWFIENIKPKLKPIFLIRNPYAAISSAICHPAWNYEFKEFIMPSGPYSDIYMKHIDLTNSFKYKEEELAFHWCLGNLHCLTHHECGKSWINVKYEDLLLNNEQVYFKIQKELAIEIPKDDFLKNLLNPSSTRIGTDKISMEAQLKQYKSKLNLNQIARISRILDYFEVKYENIKFSYQ